MKKLMVVLAVVAPLVASAADGGTSPDAGAPPPSFAELAGRLKAACEAGGGGPQVTALCASSCGEAKTPDLCAFSDPTLAQVAALVFPREVNLYGNLIAGAFSKDSPDKHKAFTPFAFADAAGLTPAITDVAVRLIQGLALVIADRARRESAAFVLDELYRGLCLTNLNTWFKSTCALAGQEADGSVSLQAYGSGAPTLELLRAALREDVRRFPGVVASEVLDQLFVLDRSTYARGNPGFRSQQLSDGGTAWYCSVDAGVPDSGSPCSIQTPEALKQAAVDAVLQLEDGAWVFDAVVGVAAEIDRANREARSTAAIPAPRSQWGACALSLPATAQRAEASFSQFSASERARGALLAGLLLSPACATMLKRSGSVAGIPALDRVLQPLVGGTELWLTQMKDGVEKSRHPTGTPVLLADGGVDLDATRTAANLERLGASLEVSAAALQLGKLWLRSAERLCAEVESPFDVVCKGASSGEVVQVLRLLELLSKELEVAQAAVAQDWNLVAVKSVGLGMEVCADIPNCKARLPKLGGPVNSALALLSAKSADDAARVIDSLASPIGEWRGKMDSGRWTLSLTAHAGVSSALEWRWGQYGVLYERGGRYLQAPSVSLPLGLEVSLGMGGVASAALMLSIIDPFAFFQYDASRDGRLPGPKLLSVLAPGAHLRFGFASPFGLGMFVVYRPGFRAWESAVNAPGASVLQLGLEATVDVTLFTLARSPR